MEYEFAYRFVCFLLLWIHYLIYHALLDNMLSLAGVGALTWIVYACTQSRVLSLFGSCGVSRIGLIVVVQIVYMVFCSVALHPRAQHSEWLL